MGVDVNLYVEIAPTDAELAAADAFFVARSRIGDAWQENDDKILYRDVEEWFESPRVAVSTLARYYGPGYERGDWPTIYGAIRVLQAAFRGAKVFYGGDSSDDGVECTDEYLAEIWRHFLGHDGDAYHQSFTANRG